NLNVNAQGIVAPGSSIGTLSVTGNATIDGTYSAEYDATGAGNADLLKVTGTLTLDPTSLLSVGQFDGPADDLAYVIASYGSLSGTFGSMSGIPAGYTINYSYNNGVNSNNIALVSVPEPATCCLLALGGLMALACCRGKNRAV